MLKQIIAASLAGLVVFALAAPALADSRLVVRGEPQRAAFQERVSYSGLDLRQGHHQRMLRRNVKAASARVCRQAYGPLPDYTLGSSVFAGKGCTDLTYEDTRPQIRSAIQRAKNGGQFAVSGAISVQAYAR